MSKRIAMIAATALLLTGAALAQSLDIPPNGGNQHATVTQYLGPVKVSIDYHSPKVHSPLSGEDRRGKIWGKLVPYGPQPTLGYGTCTQCPWRAGANENTTLTVSHDVKVEGQPLPAGSYGLHILPAESGEWTLILSKDSRNWGSFFYDPANDALRVKVKPVKNDYYEYLTYEFVDRNLDHATAELRWEDLKVPFTISVDDINGIYLAQMKTDLRGGSGFDWKNYDAAARFALQNKMWPKEALEWATIGSKAGFPGEENYTSLTTLADAQAANGLDAESQKTRERALQHPTATALDIHQSARQLLQAGKKQEALALWELNAKKHPGQWPTNVGLARGYSAAGRYAEALKYAKLALAQAPDEPNRKVLTAAIEKLQKNQDMN